MAGKPLEFNESERRLVEALTRHGVSATDVARELDVDRKTLAKHFGAVIEAAKARRRLAYLERLKQRMRAGSAPAAIKLARLGDRRRPAPLLP
jgi:transposase-like protein